MSDDVRQPTPDDEAWLKTATIWTARVVGDRVLCGRRVPPDGPYACMGEIASVVRDVGGTAYLAMRPGLYPDWIYGWDGPRYRLGKAHFPGDRARSATLGSIERGRGLSNPDRRPGDFRRRRGRLPYAEVGAIDGLWAPCSHGGHENRLPRGSLK